ncbi:MAG TPA: hypothetical protein VHM31_13080 [Polyangia bacterium]|nr:hypothetical protein [Polyangia bacterium]
MSRRFGTSRSFALLWLSLAGVACAGSVETGQKGPVASGGTTGTIYVMGGHTGSGTGGSTGPNTAKGGTTGSSGGSPGGAGSTGTTAYSDIPCDVKAVLQTNCSTCHGPTPAYGAPMTLIHAADFAKKTLDGSRTVAQAVLARINDDAHPMPPVPNARLSSADTSTLTSWIQAGAKAGACASVSDPDMGMVDPEADPTDPDVTCYNITARSSTKGKFSVPNTPDLYHCFSYAPPWGTDKVHLVSWRPLVDNKAVIHHWLLYNETSPVTDGADQDCVGAHPNAQLTAGWAPGGTGLTLPADVGEDVSGAGFTLETHYNNTGTGPSPDGSGVRVCVTKKLRPNEAGMHWLGTELILLPAGGDATGICAPHPTGPVTIISSTPHMHLQGRHLKTIINRADGTKETLIDKPFDFQSQVGYLTPVKIMPGDTLTTTCTYGGAAIYGEGTKQEMCYNFVLAYPNGGLASGSVLRKNGCTGL